MAAAVEAEVGSASRYSAVAVADLLAAEEAVVAVAVVVDFCLTVAEELG